MRTITFQDEEDDEKADGEGEEVEQNGTENGEAVADVPADESQPAAKRAKLDPESKGDSNGIPDSEAVES